MWCNTRKAEKLLKIPSDQILVFDLETTGLNTATAEILQVSIYSLDGFEVFSSYVRPTHHKSWKGAEKFNHISPEMVKDALTFAKIRRQVQEIFNTAKIVAGYNSDRYDIPIIERYGIVLPKDRFDVYSEYMDYHPGGRHRLYDCAEYFGVSYSPHDSSEDARATAACMRALISSPGFIKPPSPKKDKAEETQHFVQESSSEIKAGKRTARPLRRLFNAIIKKRKFHPMIVGFILLIIGISILYFSSGNNSFDLNSFRAFISNQLLSAALQDVKTMLFGILSIIGIVLIAISFVKKIRIAFLRFINLFRKLFTK